MLPSDSTARRTHIETYKHASKRVACFMCGFDIERMSVQICRFPSSAHPEMLASHAVQWRHSCKRYPFPSLHLFVSTLETMRIPQSREVNTYQAFREELPKKYIHRQASAESHRSAKSTTVKPKPLVPPTS